LSSWPSGLLPTLKWNSGSSRKKECILCSFMETLYDLSALVYWVFTKYLLHTQTGVCSEENSKKYVLSFCWR
jgi:hypothetical protein